jgi:threonine dehydrogenase-like Zn-dependent dehydrogenase
MVGWNEPWNGGYGEYMRVPARCILPLHDSIGLDVAVLLLDTFGTAWHAVRLGRPVGASRALVIGCGPLGLGVVAGLRAFGVPEVFASDIAPGRLEAAEELGARPVAPAEVAGLKELQIAIDVTGSTETPMQAIRAIEPEGRMVLLGEPGPWQYDPRGISLRDFSLIRSWYFTIPEFAENQQMLLDGKVDSKVLISHVFPLEKLEEAYTLFAAGRTRKVLTQVVEPE